MAATYTLQTSDAARNCHGYETGRRIYSIQSDKGMLYEVYSEGNGCPWEVATLAKRADGGRAWRWAKDTSKGIAADVIAFAKECHALHTGQTVAEVPAAAESAAPAAPVVRVIDATPTWQGVLPYLILGLVDGNEQGQRTAKGELTRMAQAADGYNTQRKALEECSRPMVPITTVDALESALRDALARLNLLISRDQHKMLDVAARDKADAALKMLAKGNGG